MNKPLDTTSRNGAEDGHDTARAALTLPPVYRWLIVLSPVLSAVSLALGLARGH